MFNVETKIKEVWSKNNCRMKLIGPVYNLFFFSGLVIRSKKQSFRSPKTGLWNRWGHNKYAVPYIELFLGSKQCFGVKGENDTKMFRDENFFQIYPDLCTLGIRLTLSHKITKRHAILPQATWPNTHQGKPRHRPFLECDLNPSQSSPHHKVKCAEHPSSSQRISNL